MSYAHSINRLEQNPACFIFRDEVASAAVGVVPASTPGYTRSFAMEITEVESRLGLKHDHHFSSQQLKEATAKHMLAKMLEQEPNCLLRLDFDLSSEHPTRVDHHLRTDAPAVIALRSRLRLNSTLFNNSLHKRKIKSSSACDHCNEDETTEHVLLSCPHYSLARSAFFDSLRFKPPDDQVLRICLGRSPDCKLKGRRATLFESASASFLLEIARLRPSI